MPLLYLVLDIPEVPNDDGLIDIKLLMLEIEKPVNKNKRIKRLYLNEKLKLNINNLLMYTEYM